MEAELAGNDPTLRPQRPAAPMRAADGARAGRPGPAVRSAVRDLPADGGSLAFVSAGRPASEFERARRHSGRVRFLKLALPIGGVATIVLLVAAYVATQFAPPSVEIGTTSIEDGKLVMANPKLAGSDNNKRPYSLTADRAIQDADNPTRITLEAIQARLPVDDSNAADIRAGIGVYDADAKTLDLSGKVAVDLNDGMTIRLEDAAIDIETGTLRTDSPVEVDTGRARVTSDSLTVQDRGKTIIFEKRVRMTLLPAGAAEGAAKQ